MEQTVDHQILRALILKIWTPDGAKTLLSRMSQYFGTVWRVLLSDQ